MGVQEKIGAVEAASPLAILSGDLPSCEWPLYEAADWNRAAQYAVDGDDSDLNTMIARETVYQEWCDLPDWHRERYLDDFDTWLDHKASWNRGIYARAQVEGAVS